VIQLLRQADAVARAAVPVAFVEEDNVERLLRRVVMAGLRHLDALEAANSHALKNAWLPGAGGRPSITDEPLPDDAPWFEMSADRDDLVVDLDGLLPLLDDSNAEPLLARLGIRVHVTLLGRAHRDDEFTVSRITLAGQDRWFPYWGGSAQDGNFDLTDAAPADRRHRTAAILEWTDWACTDIGELHGMEVRTDARMFGRVVRYVARQWPDAEVTQAARSIR